MSKFNFNEHSVVLVLQSDRKKQSNCKKGARTPSKSASALCVVLPQMTGYIKYFDNGGKNISFVI